MSTDLPPEYKVRDALHWFMTDRARNTERENQEPFSDEASYLLTQALGRLLEDRELGAYAAFEREDGGVWVFIVCGGAAYRVELLLDSKRPSKVEVESLGSLDGGRYTERFSLVPGVEGERVEVQFEHRRLPGGDVKFELEPFAPGAHRSPDLVARLEQLQRFRPFFLGWSLTAEP